MNISSVNNNISTQINKLGDLLKDISKTQVDSDKKMLEATIIENVTGKGKNINYMV